MTKPKPAQKRPLPDDYYTVPVVAHVGGMHRADQPCEKCRRLSCPTQ